MLHDVATCGAVLSLQVGVHYTGPVAAARVVLAQEGVSGFFRGASVSVGRGVRGMNIRGMGMGARGTRRMRAGAYAGTRCTRVPGFSAGLDALARGAAC